MVRTLIAAAVSSIVLTMAMPTSARDTIVAARHGSEVRVVVASRDTLMRRTGDWCRGFLGRRGYPVESRLSSLPGEGRDPVWVLETRDSCPVAQSFGIDPSQLAATRADAYLLTVLEHDGRPVVSIIGRNAVGLRSGVARFMAVLRQSGDALVAPQTSECRSPFFPIRRLAVVPTGRIAQFQAYNGLPESATKWTDTLWTNWSDERVRQYAEQLWLYGFNSIELCEIRGYRNVYKDEQLRTEVTPKLRTFMQATHDNGMQVSQFIWGQSLFKEGDNLCWNDPKERAVMEKEYRRLAQTYGDLVDHIVVHVGDPGGCSRNGCDACKTTQEIAAFLLHEYRKVNPNATATLSTWANFGFWNGHPGTRLLDDSCSPKEIGIALHRWYDPEKAKLVRESGRKLDIWGWYLSDFEMVLDMHLLMRRLDGYYSKLPKAASEQVRAVSTEICFDGWPQIINAYVTAQKMWDPYRPLDQIEREFCAGTFGERNADAMLSVYQACEACVHPENYYGFIPPSDCLPLVFGTPAYNRELRKALQAVKHVDAGAYSLASFTNSTDPNALKDYLTRNLSLIAIFSEAQESMNAAKKAGVDLATVRRIVEDAESQARPFREDLDYQYLLGTLTASQGTPTK